MLDPSITGGFGEMDYFWSTDTGSGIVQGSLKQDSLSMGNYILRSTDDIGCFREWSFDLTTVPDTIAISPDISDYNGFNISCNHGSDGFINLNTSGGVAPYLYEWSGTSPGLLVHESDQENLPTGDYSVEILDANNCPYESHFTLNEPLALSSVIIPSPVRCFGADQGSADLSVQGGVEPYTYQWSNGEITEDIADLFIGVYSVQITDLNHCEHYDSTTITQPEQIDLGLVSPPQYNGRMISCKGASDADIQSTIEGGSGGFVYLWMPGGENTPGLTNVPAGTYILKVTDVKDCISSDTIKVEEPKYITTDVYTTDPSCAGESNGEITLIPQGGTPAYSITWLENGGSGQTADSLGAGSYHVNIRDLNGCFMDTMAILKEPDPLIIGMNTENPYCPDADNGSLSINVSGGSEPYMIDWEGDYQGEYLEDLYSGIYIVKVRDNNGCMLSDTAIITSDNEDCLEVYDAFTPNGDGFNDTWVIKNIELYPEAIVEIFNRWGELIYRSDKGYNNPWDGTYRGRELPIDSYHYIISTGKNRIPKVGNVTIIK